MSWRKAYIFYSSKIKCPVISFFLCYCVIQGCTGKIYLNFWLFKFSIPTAINNIKWPRTGSLGQMVNYLAVEETKSTLKPCLSEIQALLRNMSIGWISRCPSMVIIKRLWLHIMISHYDPSAHKVQVNFPLSRIRWYPCFKVIQAAFR